MISPAHLLLPLLWITLFAHGQNTNVSKGSLSVQPTNDFEIKGDTSATAWTKTTWTLLPARMGRASYQTKVKLLYSEKGIYCLFYCQDAKITATLKEDFENLFHEDVVEIFLWPDESIPVYFEYELSPYGYELAIMVPNLKGIFYGWRPWHYNGDRVTRRRATIASDARGVTSWSAEIFIPFALLKPLVMTPPKKGNHWRANMYRIDYDEGTTEWSWQPTRENFHDFGNFGTLKFQ
jgi:hypothetical protein